MSIVQTLKKRSQIFFYTSSLTHCVLLYTEKDIVSDLFSYLYDMTFCNIFHGDKTYQHLHPLFGLASGAVAFFTFRASALGLTSLFVEGLYDYLFSHQRNVLVNRLPRLAARVARYL